RRPAARAYLLDDGTHGGAPLPILASRRSSQGGAGPCLVEIVPDDGFHSIIFSIGTTRIAEAPAFLRFCSVSQKTDSWHTEWTAKCPGRPCSGRIVGASAPGSSAEIRSSASSDAFSMMYFDSFVASTPSRRLSN